MSTLKTSNDGEVRLLVGTRKGAFIMHSDSDRANWALSDPIFLGHIIYHFVADTRNNANMLMAAKTGHLGPTVFRSTDGGATWKEASHPPAFSKVSEGEEGRAVDKVFWLSEGHREEQGTWYAGTAPAGLFMTRDDGESWSSVSGFNDNPMYSEWTNTGGTPDGLFLHSILIDSRDADHIYIGISVGGIFESLDRGSSWTPLNKGVEAEFLPSPDVPFGHDPHCVVYHPANPDRLYHQNHCGIYRLDRPGDRWVRIGKNMPPEIGDIGFPIVVHPEHVDTAWVFPMDGTEVWPRTSPGGKPAVYMTRDGGESWKRQDTGLPSEKAFLTVKRQAMTTDVGNPLGLYFGTTGGEVWASNDEGESWSCIARHLPEIYSLSVSRS